MERAGEDGDGVIGINGGISSMIFCDWGEGRGGDAGAGGGAFDTEEVVVGEEEDGWGGDIGYSTKGSVMSISTGSLSVNAPVRGGCISNDIKFGGLRCTAGPLDRPEGFKLGTDIEEITTAFSFCKMNPESV